MRGTTAAQFISPTCAVWRVNVSCEGTSIATNGMRQERNSITHRHPILAAAEEEQRRQSRRRSPPKQAVARPASFGDLTEVARREAPPARIEVPRVESESDSESDYEDEYESEEEALGADHYCC